jgi:Bacterial Ig-like domain (group 3)
MVSTFFPGLLRRKHQKPNRRLLCKRCLSIELLEKREVLTDFTPGNLIILQAGDGSAYNGTAPLFLGEYSVNGKLVQMVALPNNLTVGGPGNQPITIDLSAAAGNGQLNRSYDGSVLTFGGVDSGISSVTATGSADRVIAIVGIDPAAANFFDTTTHGQFYVGDDNRGAVAESANGPIWSVGHPNQAGGAVSQGVHYFPGPGPSIGTQVSAGANIRGATIGFDNRLYFSTAGSTQTGLAGIYTEAQALPTNATPASDVPVVSALFSASKLGGVYLADVNGTGVLENGDRLYFLDDGTVGGAGTGGLYVSTYNTAYPGNHWSTAVRLGEGIISDQPNPQASAQLRGLAGTVISPTETDLYVTEFDNVGGNNSYILKFADTGTGVNIASASESGNVVTITTALPNNFTTGQTVAVDGINTGLGGSTIVSDGYNGRWTITVLDSTHFTYTDTNAQGTGLATVTNQGAADVAVSPTIAATLADGSVTINGSTYAAQGIRGVAFAPVAPTIVNLAVNGSPSTTVSPGTPITFVATLNNSQVTPTGVVTFIDQSTNTVLGQGTISTTGGITSATFTTTLVGNHLVTAYFAGGGTSALASATSTPVTVIEAGSTASATVVIPSLSASALGLPITLTATVTGSGSMPTGTVSFYNGGINLGNLLGTATLASGTAAFTTSLATAGTQDIIAIYNGDDTYSSSQGTIMVTIAANAIATIASSANNVPVGATPTYTVTLTGNPALGTPTGMVQFFLDGAPLGAALAVSSGPNNTATATVTSTALSAGSHFVTMSYTADSPYASFALDTTTATNGVAFIETAQQAFTPGDLIAIQRGDGSVNLGSSGYLVFLDEYTPAGALVQKIALPNIDAGNSHGLLLSGQNGAEGLLSRSADGYYLTLAGYDVPVGQQFVTSTFPYQFVRTIARIDLSGNVDTSTAISTTTGNSVPYNPSDVVSYDGNEFWLVSNLPVGDTTDSGIEYIATLGANGAIQIGPLGTTGAALTIAGGQLYAASTDLSSGTAVGVWQVGTGLPTAPTTLLALPGLLEAYQAAFPNGQNPKQLLFFNHNDGTSNNPDTLFIADQSNGLLKFWFDGTKWIFGNGSATNPFGQKLVFAGGATGVIGYVVNPGPNAQFQLYVTGSNVQGQNPNQVASYLDSGAYNGGFSSGNFSTLAFVGAVGGSPNGNENFAGLAFAPGYHTRSALASSANPAPQGQSVTFTVTVTAPSGTPTGVVAFYDGTAFLGTAIVDANGVATLSINTLTVGDHSITASYYGDVTDGISTSDVLVETISGAQVPPRPNRTAVDFLVLGAASATGMVRQSNDGSISPPPVTVQTPIMMLTERGPNLSPVEKAARSVIALTEAARVDTFWRLFAANELAVDDYSGT